MSNPREAEIVLLRRERPSAPVELVIKHGDEEQVFVLRIGQLANLAVDAVRFALAAYIESPWREIWERPFDFPERPRD